MYLSYLMGGEDITDKDLSDLGIKIVRKTESGNREIKIPQDTIERYKDLVREKMTAGFWNEFMNEKEIYFIFKLESGELKEYVLSPENEQEIDKLCAKLNNEPPDKTANVYKYISDNDFYHDFMMQYYKDMVER